MKTRIFISAVTRELKSARQLAANTLTALGYEPVWQDIFDTTSDDIRPMLRKKIDSCSAILQIVGDAYGAEPPQPDEEFGRVSYTQYELLYAKSKGKKVYYLMAQDDLPRDENGDMINVALDDTAEATEDAKERARLQSVYREQILAAEQVYYPVSSHSETELSVRRLRDDLAKMRRGFRGWMIGVSVALILIAGGIFWQMHSAGKQNKKLDDMGKVVKEIKDYIVNPDRMRDQIVRSIEETYDSAVAKSQKLKSWRDRDEAVKLAERQRDDNLDRVDEFLKSIVAEIESGEASPESIEFARILEEEGADEAIAYISSRKKQILTTAQKLAEKTGQTKSELRRELAPLLESARLLANKGQYESARQQCADVLEIDPSWPEALHVQIWHLFELGDLAQRFQTVNDAFDFYQSGEKLSKRLAFGAEAHTEAQRDLSVSYNKLGDVFLKLGQTDEALAQYQAGLKISEKLAQADPSDSQKQRDLSVISYSKLGNVFLKLGQTDEALAQYQAGLKISEKLAQADPSDSQKQRDLSVSYNKLGDVFLTLGQTDEALAQYQAGLKISEKLAQADPSDSQKQRDLSVSYNNLGDVFLKLGQTDEALAQYQAGLKISEKLAQADPSDSQKQRDLSVSYNKLGDVFLKLGQTDEALAQYQAGLKISEKLAQADPSDSQKQRDLSVSYNNLGDVFLKLGQTDEALAQYQAGLKISEKLAQADPSDSQKQRDLSVFSYNKLGNVFLKLGQTDEALAQYQAGLKIREKLAQADPSDSQKQRDLSVSYNKLGDVFLKLGQTDEALAQYQAGFKISEKLAQADPSDSQKQRDLSVSYSNLGDVFLKLGQTDEALAQYQAGLKISEKLAQGGSQRLTETAGSLGLIQQAW